MTTDSHLSPEAIRTQTEQILKSARFRGSEKQKGFLNFVVTEALSGRGSQLKGYTVALEVYGRKEGLDRKSVV